MPALRRSAKGLQASTGFRSSVRQQASHTLALSKWGGAGEGNRTLVVSLGSFCSAIELHPRGNAFYASGPIRANAPGERERFRESAPRVARGGALA
jgi:hypothetical protein